MHYALDIALFFVNHFAVVSYIQEAPPRPPASPIAPLGYSATPSMSEVFTDGFAPCFYDFNSDIQ